MFLSAEWLPEVPADRLKAWVLAPSLNTSDANIDYYYDFSQSIEEYQRTFAELGIPWQWQPVTMENYRSVIEQILREKETGHFFPVVLNLCDGDEINGTPGISVLIELESKGLVYTGADEYFYRITTSKIPMKQAFEDAGVATPAWMTVKTPNQDLSKILEEL
ncbi:MAG: hypothetical protein KGO92_12485, partial [Bacteroidota bacterium]|nr:hypothetical protein [Bacteroidota bacterium]